MPPESPAFTVLVLNLVLASDLLKVKYGSIASSHLSEQHGVQMSLSVMYCVSYYIHGILALYFYKVTIN